MEKTLLKSEVGRLILVRTQLQITENILATLDLGIDLMLGITSLRHCCKGPRSRNDSQKTATFPANESFTSAVTRNFCLESFHN